MLGGGAVRTNSYPLPAGFLRPLQELLVSPRLLSIPAVAAALDVDRRTVYRFIASGDLPVVDLRTGAGRSRVRVPVAGLDDFISSRTVGPVAARR
ncbi:helix-turn-helix domain-containing protein [Streptomyces sp. NPDC048340]|uniref:helix-turn-helix domain-containing protein n=1 Tax=Streptomyces sp. NPDC048340 TaxID=3365537 RepID=UPI0037200483